MGDEIRRNPLQPDQFAASGNAEYLIKVWEDREKLDLYKCEDTCIEFSRKSIALGQVALAFDILREGMVRFPRHVEMQYLAALALAKSGSSGHAASILRGLLPHVDSSNPHYVDIMSLAGRIAKDRWSKLPDGASRTDAGIEARNWYQRAYEISRDYFPGINAATLNVLTGNVKEGRHIAIEVRNKCLAAQTVSENTDYWLYATLGEACLLLGEREMAVEQYAKAAGLAGNNYGDIATMRRQARLLANEIENADEILRVLEIPRVVVFSGHMIDMPDRTEPRFPSQIEDAVQCAIADVLEQVNAGFGYCSAACGGDIIFIEEMLRRGAEVNVLLPFRQEDFIRTSVGFAGEKWVERFRHALTQAASINHAVDESYLGDDILFEYTSRLMQGMALLRAEQLEIEPLLVAVMEPGVEQKAGGTMANVQQWRQHGYEHIVINLNEIRESKKGIRQTTAAGMSANSGPFFGHGELVWGKRQIKTMLFADMVGFSKLEEHDAPSFFVHFLGEIAKVIDASPDRPAFWNTWGDGLYLVFDDVLAACSFALRLRDAVVEKDWEKSGLPKDINIRIGMHTGPVFPALDPIINRQNFFGSHVNRAARIEPITAPGSVFVSEQTASMLTAVNNKDFACDYLGKLALAKGFGSSRIYRLRRFHQAE